MGHAGGFDRPEGDAAGPPRAWAPTEAMSAYMRKHQSAATTGDRRPVFNTICFSAVGNSPANRSSSAAPGGARRRPSKAAAGSKVDIPSTSGARLYAGKLPQSGNTCVEPPTSLPFAGFMSSQRGRDSAKPSAQTHSPGVVSGSSQRGDRTAAAQTAKQSDVWFQVPLGNGGGKQLLHPLYHQFLLNGKLALENCGFSSPHDGFSNSHRPKNDIGHLSRTVASVEKEATCGGQSDALLGSTASNGPNSRICNSKETMATQVQKQAARTSDDTLISSVEYTANGRISYPYESETNPTGIGFKSVPLAPPTPNKCSSVVILPSSTMTPVAREPQLSPLSSLSAKKSKELLDQSPSEERKPDKVVGLATGMEPFQMYSSQGHSVPPNGTSSSHWVFPQLEKQENGKHGGHAIDFAIPISDSLAPVTPGKSSHGSCTPHNEVIDIVDSSDDEENEMERVDCVDLPAKGESLAIYNHGTAVQESQSSDNLHQSTLEQNQAEDKLEHNGIDLNQTPKPKSSRKKHRPKVVKEGASKKKVKQTTPTSTGTPATKRKYSRRKEAEAIETPSNRNGETSNPTKKRVRRSVTRSLQFDSEATQQEPNIQPVEMLLQHKQGSGYHGNGQQNINCFSQGPETLEELPCGATREFNYLIEKRTGETGKENAQASRITLLSENSRDLGMVRDNDQISSISQSSLPAGLPCTHGSQVINGSQSNYNYMSSDVHSQYWNMIMGNYETRKPCLVKNKDAENLQSYEPLHSYQTSDRRTDEIGGCKQGTNASSFFSAHCFDGEQNNNSLNSQSIYNNLEMNPKGGNKNLIYEASITSPNTGISYAQLSQMPNVCPSRNQRHVPSKVVEPVQTQGMNTQTNLSRVQADKGENSQHGGNNKSTELPVNNSKVLPPSEDVQIVYNNLSLSALHQKAVQESSQAVFQFDGKAPQFGVSSANNVVDLDLLELVIFKLKYLRISDDNLEVSTQNQIVPYNGLGTIVPFHGVADISKKRKPRAKVDLDSETNRVWLLLMGKESDPGADEKNANKEKWWEEERRVFQGRAESFIARMHLVQGDRRFSRWKGSVVDSVVGVFLTQNVSDHLSSSAFMSMAARFPVRTRKSHLDSAKQMEFINLGDDFSEQKEKMLNQPMATPRFESFTQMQYLEERENWKNGYVEGTSNTGLASYCNEISVCYPQTDKQSSVTAFQMCTPSPFTRNVISAVEGLKTTDAALLSQNSVISFQNSFPSFSQLVDHVDPPADSQCTTSRPSHSFMEILLMAGAGDLEGLSKVAFQENMDSTTRSDASRNVGFETSPSCLDDSFNLNKAYTFEGMNDLQFCHGKNDYSGVPDISSFDSTTQPVSRLLGVENSETVNASHSQQSFVKVTTGTNHIRTPHIAYSSKQNLTEFSDNIQPVFSNNTLSTHNSQRKAYTELLTSMSYNSAQPKFLSLLHQEPMLNNLLHASTCSQNNGKPAIITSQLPNNTSYHSVASKVKSCDTKIQQVSGGGKVMSGNTSNIVTKINVNSSTDAPMNSEKTGVKTRKGKVEKEKTSFDWDSLRRQSINRIAKQERSSDRMDSVDWESVRSADVKEISSIIRERGMNNMLSERIKDFLDRLVREHESIDLEWLRDVPPDQAKDYLLSIRGLGLKSVECVRLLTLHHLAFPVDTNVGRICVRLGWVPLQPLPESLQLHLLEMYPLLETIQKYLWPRLCKLDQKTLYELHYQMITFGKVFCTKSKPNCNACPMRGECKHFASAFASARLPLPGPEDNRLVMAQNSIPSEPSKPVIVPMNIPQLECGPLLEGTVINNCEPIIEEPATPEHDSLESLETEIEDAFYEDPDEIPVIKLNIQQFALNLQTIMQGNMEIQEGDMSKALVALTPEAASIPQPKLKNINRLRTEHQVYELPDSHPLLEGLEQREPDDPCPYLLSIWTPGETAQSTELPDISCTFQENGGLCDKMTCFACNSKREAHSQTVRGTLLVPCRTAMRGSFPLNGTYFQVNEVFADHSSSLSPIEVPRKWIWNLPRRTVYFGTSVPTIFRGLTTEGIQHCFWRGFVCVRGFDRETRAPRPLMARLHFPVSKTLRKKRMAGKENEQIQQN